MAFEKRHLCATSTTTTAYITEAQPLAGHGNLSASCGEPKKPVQKASKIYAV